MTWGSSIGSGTTRMVSPPKKGRVGQGDGDPTQDGDDDSVWGLFDEMTSRLPTTPGGGGPPPPDDKTPGEGTPPKESKPVGKPGSGGGGRKPGDGSPGDGTPDNGTESPKPPDLPGTGPGYHPPGGGGGAGQCNRAIVNVYTDIDASSDFNKLVLCRQEASTRNAASPNSDCECRPVSWYRTVVVMYSASGNIQGTVYGPWLNWPPGILPALPSSPLGSAKRHIETKTDQQLSCCV